MARDLSEAAAQFADLAKNLTLVGAEGLRRELYRAIDEAARPLASEIRNVDHLRDYMPGRYAGVLAADLRVTTHKRVSVDPGVTILARAPTFGRGGRKIRQREEGMIAHPLFGDRGRWFVQVKGMKAGFFTGPAQRAAPEVLARILAAMERTANKAAGKG